MSRRLGLTPGLVQEPGHGQQGEAARHSVGDTAGCLATTALVTGTGTGHHIGLMTVSPSHRICKGIFVKLGFKANILSQSSMRSDE